MNAIQSVGIGSKGVSLDHGGPIASHGGRCAHSLTSLRRRRHLRLSLQELWRLQGQCLGSRRYCEMEESEGEMNARSR